MNKKLLQLVMCLCMALIVATSISIPVFATEFRSGEVSSQAEPRNTNGFSWKNEQTSVYLSGNMKKSKLYWNHHLRSNLWILCCFTIYKQSYWRLIYSRIHLRWRYLYTEFGTNISWRELYRHFCDCNTDCFCKHYSQFFKQITIATIKLIA